MELEFFRSRFQVLPIKLVRVVADDNVGVIFVNEGDEVGDDRLIIFVVVNRKEGCFISSGRYGNDDDRVFVRNRTPPWLSISQSKAITLKSGFV